MGAHAFMRFFSWETVKEQWGRSHTLDRARAALPVVPLVLWRRVDGRRQRAYRGLPSVLGTGSGRNTARSALGGEFSGCTLSARAVGPNSTMTNVSASPLFDPGRSDYSRHGGILTVAFPPTAFPLEARLKCRPIYALPYNGLLVSIDPHLMVWFILALRPGPAKVHHVPRAPLPDHRCYLDQRGVFGTTSEGSTPPS